jgi:competence protein ComEC
MPSWGLLCCSIVSVVGTLAATPLSPELRPLEDLGLAAFAAYVCFGREPPRFRAVVLLALVAAACNAALRQPAGPIAQERRTARYVATLVQRESEGDGSTSLRLQLDGGAVVSARVRGAVPAPGARLIVRGRLEPFDEARNPGDASEREMERERGLDGRLDAATILSVTGSRWSAAVALSRAHEWAHERLRDRLGEPAASLLAGELWGERSALPPSLRTEFQETGTVHVLATAGLHMGAVSALALFALAFFALPRGATCVGAIAVVWAFVWWSGAQLPAERAAAMATAALAARACGRATFSWNALGLAAIAVELARPESVAGASFALSFSCVGAIFACAAPLDRWIEARIALPHRLREALTLTLATQLGTWPLSAAVFFQFAPYALAANFAVVPCVAATMALGAAQLALEWCAPLAGLCADLNAWLLAWMLGVVQTVSQLPGAVIPMAPAPAWCIAAYDAALLAAPVLWRRPFVAGALDWRRTFAVAALLSASALVLWPPQRLDPRLRITVLDVGQADAIVIQTPRGHTFLVDAGGRLERVARGGDSDAERVGERIVVPFLLRRGIHTVDALILSHPHGDHAGGVAPVLRRLGVAQFDDSGQRYGGYAYRDAVATARMRGVPILHPRAATRWRTDDGLILDFIGPSLPFIAGGNAINSNSLSFVLRYRDFRMLFTGDAGSEAEQRFLRERVDLRATVLKVGHHGSAYGSTPQFIAAVAPRYAIISVGRHNLFGHPAQSTLSTLRHFGARIYRTDEDGAVTVVTDGSSLRVSSALGKPSIERRAQAPSDPTQPDLRRLRRWR